MFGSIKERFGHDLDMENELALQAEALCKVLAHNICVVIDAMYAMDLEPEFAVEEKQSVVEKTLEFTD